MIHLDLLLIRNKKSYIAFLNTTIIEKIRNHLNSNGF